MESDKKLNSILQATPWRCFHCDFITNDPEEAAAHFGDRDDAEEFKPICKWWDRMPDDRERLETLQDTVRELNKGAEENMRLLTHIEGLEHQVATQESDIRAYKPFKNCRSIYDVFCEFDSMEGRALAAEERERVLVEAVNDAGFQVMLSDDGKTFIKPCTTSSGIPAQSM